MEEKVKNNHIKKYTEREKKKKINKFWYKTFILLFHYILVAAGIIYLALVNFFTTDVESGFIPWAVFFALGLLVIRLLITTRKYSNYYLQGKIELNREKWKYRSITIWYLLLSCTFVIAVVISLQFNTVSDVKLYSFVIQTSMLLFMGSIIMNDNKKLKK